jgi:hypothetical protein
MTREQRWQRALAVSDGSFAGIANISARGNLTMPNGYGLVWTPARAPAFAKASAGAAGARKMSTRNFE